VREARQEDLYDFLCVLRVIFATFAVKGFCSNGTHSAMNTFVWCSRNAGFTSDAFADANAKVASDLCSFLKGARSTPRRSL
jgi:hypothetical protein